MITDAPAPDKSTLTPPPKESRIKAETCKHTAWLDMMMHQGAGVEELDFVADVRGIPGSD